MKDTTLGEFGFELPVPVKLTQLQIALPKRSFQFKPWRMAEEKKAGELRQRHKHPSVFLRELLNEMLSELGGQDWPAYDKTKRPLVMAMLPYADVFYLYLCLRISALGEEFKFLPTTCPACSTYLEGVVADLNKTEVKVVEDEDADRLVYDLRVPYRVGEVDVTSLVFSRTPWDTMTQLPAGDMQNAGAVKDAFLTSSLVAAKSKEAGDKDIALDRGKLLAFMAKRDIEGAHKALSEFNGGPSLAREIECDKCGHTWGAMLDWTYDHFFGTSSL